MSRLASVILFTGVVAYALFGGADFGAGFWDLTAGRARRPRELIDHSIGPVWEANHVWLIFCLVVLWTAFPSAFAAISSTLYLPLGAAAIGIILRGCGFAFRKAITGSGGEPFADAAFAASSVVTPFFLGAVAGGIASGRVPAQATGDPFTSWLNPTSVLGGALAVVTCAYLAAVFLSVEARARAEPDLEQWFRRRAIGAALAAGALSLAGVVVLRADAPRLFHRLLGAGLPLVAASAAGGLASLALLGRGATRLSRVMAVVAVAAVVGGWGVAQYPYLLGTHVKVDAAAAPSATIASTLVVALAAGAVCLPSLGFLYVLHQRGRLDEA